MAQGTIKSYDPISNTGLILDDSGTDVPIGEDAIKTSIFIMLRQGQRVIYEKTDLEGLTVARNLRLGQDGR